MRDKGDATDLGADAESARLRDEVEALRKETARLRRQVHCLKAQEAESEARFRTMADAAPVMMWMTDPDGQCTFVNKPWLEFCGRSFEQELGDGWQQDVHPDDLDRCMRIFREAIALRAPFEVEYRLRRADGVYHWVSDSGVPRFTPEGEFAGHVGAAADVEEPRRLVKELQHRSSELQRANARLHELDRLKTSFMSAVSHELRTPLTSIQGFAEFLEDEVGGALSEDQRQFVASIMDGARRLRGMVDDLLDFTQLNAGTLTLVQQEVDLGPIVCEAVSEIRTSSGEKELDVSDDVPDESLVVWADAGRIRQVLLNLLHNAMKFTPPGGCIHVEACQRGSEVMITVTDTGIGISDEHQKHLFERFFQVDSSYTRTTGGTGMGLSLSRALVEAHGGHIGVKSREGQGSTFWFTVPLSGRRIGAESELRITIMPEQELPELSGDRPAI